MNSDEFFAEALSNSKGPLEGIVVVEAATTWAGPLAACLLGDHGADVIKVEEPGGDIGRRIPPFLPGIEPPLSFWHANVNRNKRSLELNLHDAGDRARMATLLAKADIFVNSFRPGVLDEWGLGYNDVKSTNEGLIYVSLSGYGQYGKNRGRAGYDPLVQAYCGFMALNGATEGEPTKAPTFIGDDFAGLHAALAAMTALWHRQATGVGQNVDIALVDSMVPHMCGFLTLGAMNVPYPRVGSEYPFAAPANVFDCADGSVYAGVLLDDHWAILARVIGRPELSADPDYLGASRIARRAEVNALLGAWLRERTVDEAIDTISAAGLPIGPVNDLQSAARDMRASDRDLLPDIDVGNGQRVPVSGPAAKLARTPLKLRTAAPACVGEHNEEIFAEFGL